MLAARRALIASVFALTVIGTLLLVIFMPRSWTASTDIFIDYRTNDPLTGNSFPATLDEGYMQTQIDLLSGRRVAELAISSLNWPQDSNRTDTTTAQDKADADEQLEKTVMSHTSVTGLKSSRVLTVSYTDHSPERARDMANAMVAAYFQVLKDMSQSAMRSRDELYQEQLGQLRRKAETIQQTLVDYERQTGIVGVQEDNGVDMRQLQNLNSLLQDVRNRRESSSASIAKIQDLLSQGMDPSLLPEIAHLGSIQLLKDKRSEVERRIGEVSGDLGPNHPTMRALQASRAQFSKELKQEAMAAVQGLELEDERLRSQEIALTQEISKIENKLLTEKTQRIQIEAYQRQLANAEQSYTQALQKYNSLPIGSDATPAAVSIMRKAELPAEPSAPSVLRSLVASVIVGALLGIFLALLLELVTRKVRCADDLERDAALPLLGTIGLEQ